MYKERTPSKVLNSDSTVMGLSIFDICLVVGLYTVINPIFYHYNFEIFTLIICVFFTLFLIPIRLTQRRHIIRDYFYYYFNQYFLKGIGYDPKANKYNHPKYLK